VNIRGRLSKLVALANRPGTAEEGAAARTLAARLAARHGLELVETQAGELIAIDAFRADLIRRLHDIAEGRKRVAREINEGGS
jgi:hypothetical protein